MGKDCCNFGLVAIKRKWIPEWAYSFAVLLFGQTLPTKQPLRWMLHTEVERSPERTI